MTLRIVGAGLGRTGTLSLKVALERLLGAPCYHMAEVFQHPEHVPLWHAAALGNPPAWDELMAGYVATVDWPAAAFWPELSAAYPEALVLLSTRDARAWWESASNTIFQHSLAMPAGAWRSMIDALFGERFTSAIHDAEAAMAAFERHNAEVRWSVPAPRLVEWQPGQGWEPLCRALGVPVPDEPFPHVNTRDDWARRRTTE